MSPIDTSALIAEWRASLGNLLRGLCYLGCTLAFGASVVAAIQGQWHGFLHTTGAMCLLLLALGYFRLQARVFRLESVGVRVKVNARLELGDEIEIEPASIERQN